MRTIIFSLVLLFFVAGCEKPHINGDFVYVSHHGADLPVWVKGNIPSGVFLIYLHGGPGGSSFIDIQNSFMAGIENHYAMVYYDQRASGNSLGHSKNEQLNLDQFIEDLDVIVEYVQTTYDPTEIMLMGHSWGGTLGTAYLLQDENQSKISAWIEVDGGHSLGQNAYEYSRDYVIQVADSLIGRNEQPEAWREIKAYYTNKSSWRNPEVVIQHSKYVTQAGGYFYDPANQEGLVGLDQILFSETDFLALLAQNKHVVQHMDVWHLDFTHRLDEIEIPTLLLWGKADGILPVQLAYEAKAAMNLPEEHFYIFQESAHSPHYEQTVLFNEKVVEFVQACL